jgi:hypothetical protein
MPEKFIVPQFIDSEDKILGPITVRQFLTLIAATFLIFIEKTIFTLAPFIFLALITAGVAGTFAFLKINGQPFHLFFVNVLQTWSRWGWLGQARTRVWDKTLNNDELRQLLVKKAEAKAEQLVSKSRPSSTRLRDLSLTVNTGGVYNVEDDES